MNQLIKTFCILFFCDGEKELHLKVGVGLKVVAIFVIAMGAFFMHSNCYGNKIPVHSVSELLSAIDNVQAGDTILVANGTYNTTGNIAVNNKKGTVDKPIVILAETIGGVTITGEGGFILGSGTQYVVIKGFVFKHKASGSSNPVSYCTYTRNVYELVAPDDTQRPTYYLYITGGNNEISYNTFKNKTFLGPMLSLQGPGSEMATGNWIHHNHFQNFPDFGRNNNAAIQPGYRERMYSRAHMIIEHNLFENLNADAEGVISVKCWNVIFRYNTIRKSRDTNLRQGQESEIYGNYFINSKVRFSGSDHKIYNNTFIGGDGQAIVAVSRKTDDPVHVTGFSHNPPDRVFVGFNTMINCEEGFSHRGGGGLTGLQLVNNIFVNCTKAVDLANGGNWVNPVFEENIIWNSSAGDLPASGFRNIDPKIITDSEGIPYIMAGSPAIGNAVGDYPFVTEDIQRQPRGVSKDIGSVQFSESPVLNWLLSPSDVGPLAEGTNQLLSVPYAWTADTLLISKNGRAYDTYLKDNVDYFGVPEIEVEYPFDSIPTVTDKDGNTYNTVKIGSQVWMAENLRVTKYNDNTSIPKVTDRTSLSNLTTPAYCYYNNTSNEDAINTYGALYNWYAVETEKLCPKDWHVPSDEEWAKLTDYLGVMAGGRMKESGTEHWRSPNTGAIGDSKFAALPGGLRITNGAFHNFGTTGYWWSSTGYSVNKAWHRYLYFDYSNVLRTNHNKEIGFSVRCLMD